MGFLDFLKKVRPVEEHRIAEVYFLCWTLPCAWKRIVASETPVAEVSRKFAALFGKDQHLDILYLSPLKARTSLG